MCAVGLIETEARMGMWLHLCCAFQPVVFVFLAFVFVFRILVSYVASPLLRLSTQVILLFEYLHLCLCLCMSLNLWLPPPVFVSVFLIFVFVFLTLYLYF